MKLLRLLAVISLMFGSVLAAATEEFSSVKTIAELDQAVTEARKQSKPVMVDFTAAWCAPCKKMEESTFSDPSVRDLLLHFVLLEVDVTKNSDQDRTLLKRFKAQGPPVIAFFDTRGRELKQCQLNGYAEAGEFRRHVDACRKRYIDRSS